MLASMSLAVEPSVILEDIASAISGQKCILFLGAGIHAPPPDGSPFHYPEQSRPPFGSELSRQLAQACNLDRSFPDEDPSNLQRVSLFYEITRSRHQLVDAVRARVHEQTKPSPMLRALAELDFPLVITTNYDQLFETALVSVGKRPRVAVYTPELEQTEDFRQPTAESPIVFKIHGDITRPETMVITDEDYIQFVLRMNNKEPYDPIPLTLKYYLSDYPTLFVGYSLIDYNLRLLFKTLRWKIDRAKAPDMYAVDVAPDPLIFDVWHNQRRYVKFVVEDAYAAVPELYRLVRGEELSP
jgi:SIR2-like domain